MKHILLPILFALCALLISLPTHAQQWQMISEFDGQFPGDQLGSAVSFSEDGNIIAIGADFNDNNGMANGQVAVYEWNGTNWQQMGSDIYGQDTSDWFGASLSLSDNGTRMAVGADGHDGNGSDAGHVRIFDWNGSFWVQVGQDIDGEAANDRSGLAINLSGDGSRLAVGAPLNDGNGRDAGHVRIYEWNGSSWVQLGQDIDGENGGSPVFIQQDGDRSGHSVSLSSDGSRVAIGAPNNVGIGSGAGHTRIYDWNGSSWVQVGQDIDGEIFYEGSGSSVSLSSNGTRVAIGAPENTIGIGRVRVYDWTGSFWQQVGQDISGDFVNDQTGRSISLSSDGNRLAVGDPNNSGNGSTAGHVRVYDWNGLSWVQIGQDIEGEAPADFFSGCLAISGNGSRLAAGTRFNDGIGIDAGHVRVYELDNNSTSIEALLESNFPTIVSAYPSPFQRDLTVELGDNYSSITMRVYDILGKEVYGEDFYDSSILNAALDLPSGTYSIIISDDAGSEAELKVTVKR